MLIGNVSLFLIKVDIERMMNNLAKQGKIDPADIFKPAFVCYEPEEIKRIMHMLGLKPSTFAQWFGVSESAVKAWISPRGSAKHAECLGAAGKLMYWAAVVANERGSAQGNLIRLRMKK